MTLFPTLLSQRKQNAKPPMVICQFIEALDTVTVHQPAEKSSRPSSTGSPMSTTISLTKWSTPRELSDRTTHGKPALATKSGVICMAWRSFGQDNIWVSVSSDNGKTWSEQKELDGYISRSAPAMATYNGKFIMTWRSPGMDCIWVSTSADGLGWTPKKALTDRSTSDAPSMAAVDGIGAVMAWRGTNNTIWVSISEDGENWDIKKELTDRITQSGPAITGTTHNGGLFAMMWRGADQDNLWTSNSRDGLNWSTQKEISSSTTTASPGLAHTGAIGVFYAAWHGLDTPNGTNIFVSYSTDGINYMSQAGTGMKSLGGPSITPTGGSLLMAFRGAKKNNIFVSNLQLRL